MKKDGEPSIVYRGAVHIIFILFIVYVLSVFFTYPELFGEGSITGHAVYSQDEAKTKIEAAFTTATFMTPVKNANICIQIKDGDAERVFKVRSSPVGIVATISSGYCNGQTQEDLIIKFVSYDAFTELMDSFTIANIVSGRAGNKYYILPSATVRQGGDVICNDAFKSKFCNAISQFGSVEELITGDLYCCADSLTKDQQKLLADHITNSGFQNEQTAVQQQPSGVGSFLSSYVFFVLIGVLVVLGGGVFVFMKKPKAGAPATPTSAALPAEAQAIDPKIKQLSDYIANTLKAGYPKEQIIQYLQQQGWQQADMDKALRLAEQPAQPVQTAPEPQNPAS